MCIDYSHSQTFCTWTFPLLCSSPCRPLKKTSKYTHKKRKKLPFSKISLSFLQGLSALRLSIPGTSSLHRRRALGAIQDADDEMSDSSSSAQQTPSLVVTQDSCGQTATTQQQASTTQHSCAVVAHLVSSAAAAKATLGFGLKSMQGTWLAAIESSLLCTGIAAVSPTPLTCRDVLLLWRKKREKVQERIEFVCCVCSSFRNEEPQQHHRHTSPNYRCYEHYLYGNQYVVLTNTQKPSKPLPRSKISFFVCMILYSKCTSITPLFARAPTPNSVK